MLVGFRIVDRLLQVTSAVICDMFVTLIRRNLAAVSYVSFCNFRYPKSLFGEVILFHGIRLEGLPWD